MHSWWGPTKSDVLSLALSYTRYRLFAVLSIHFWQCYIDFCCIFFSNHYGIFNQPFPYKFSRSPCNKVLSSFYIWPPKVHTQNRTIIRFTRRWNNISISQLKNLERFYWRVGQNIFFRKNSNIAHISAIGKTFQSKTSFFWANVTISCVPCRCIIFPRSFSTVFPFAFRVTWNLCSSSVFYACCTKSFSSSALLLMVQNCIISFILLINPSLPSIWRVATEKIRSMPSIRTTKFLENLPLPRILPF